MVGDVTIVFTFNGRTLHLRYRSLPFHAWEDLKASLGFTPKTLLDAALGEADVEAVAGIIWLERKQRERNLSWPEVRASLSSESDFEILDVLHKGKPVFGNVDDESEEDEQSPDPTASDTSTPTSPTSITSIPQSSER